MSKPISKPISRPISRPISKPWLAVLATLCLSLGCEEDQTIQASSAIQRRPEVSSYTRPGQRGFEEMTTGDSTGRARFCDEIEATKQVAELVEKPIIPDVSVGGVPLWTAEAEPVVADDLIGRPEDGKLCDPAGRYANAFVFGPLNEIIVIFDEQTRLVQDIQVNSAYRGTLTGKVKHGDTTEEVFIRTRDRVRIGGTGPNGGRELNEYASSAQQAGRPNSWLNYQNITVIYGMIRQTFFGAEPLAPGYDCVAERRCDVIYSGSDENTPQQTLVVFQDSGVTLVFSPEGHVLNVVASPVRKATFELAAVVSFGGGAPDQPPALTPVLQSALVPSCIIDLASQLRWADFRSRCLPDQVRELARANYKVHGQRDAVSVEFDSVTFDFLRGAPNAPVFEDGEAPADDDRLYSLTYTRTLPAISQQFVAQDLAARYAGRLRAHLAASLTPEAAESHPFRNFEVPLPPAEGPGALSTRPQRIGALEVLDETGMPVSWVDGVKAAVHDSYSRLSPADRAAVDPSALKDVALTDPFVGAVMSAFSFGKSDEASAFTVFQTTDNERWSIGFSHFLVDGVPHRLIVQYSLFFGAVTAVTIERGQSPVDDIFSKLTAAGAAQGLPVGPYYDLRLASPRFAWNPFRLGGTGIVVHQADQRLNTVSVELATPEGPRALVVPGSRIEDRAGYLRPLRGERQEFVPAHSVALAGKETTLVFHVLPDGKIGRVQQRRFKANLSLCPGLPLAYGDNVRTAIDAWHALAGDSVYQNCELVFHYSEDGRVLTGVSSLATRTQFSTVAERAVDVAIWQ